MTIQSTEKNEVKPKGDPKREPSRETTTEPIREPKKETHASPRKTQTEEGSKDKEHPTFANDLPGENEVSLIESGRQPEKLHSEPASHPADEKQSNEHFDRT